MKKYIKLIAIFILILTTPGCTLLTGKRILREDRDIEQVTRWVEIARVSYKVGDYNEAIAYYRRVIKHYPNTKYAKEAKLKIKLIQLFKGPREIIRKNPGIFLGP